MNVLGVWLQSVIYMPTGTIEFLDKSRGFGFVTTDDTPKLVGYISINDIEESDLTEGERVEFEIEDGRSGLRAFRVKRLS